MSFWCLGSHPFSPEIFSLTAEIYANTSQRKSRATARQRSISGIGGAVSVRHTKSVGSTSRTNFCCFRSCTRIKLAICSKTVRRVPVAISTHGAWLHSSERMCPNRFGQVSRGGGEQTYSECDLHDGQGGRCSWTAAKEKGSSVRSGPQSKGSRERGGSGWRRGRW